MPNPDIQAVKERLKSAYVLEVAPHPDDLFLLLQSHDELERMLGEAINLKSDGCRSCLEDIRAFMESQALEQGGE